MNIFKSAGIAAGVVVGIILVVILFKFANKDHKTRTEYDERQMIIRGRAYMYAFYTILSYECLMLFLAAAEVRIPVEDFILHFIGIALGCMVLAGYSIWNDVYWGLNNDPKRYGYAIAAIILLNAVPVVKTFMDGEMFQDGKISSVFINLIVLIMMVVLVVLLLIKKQMNKSMDQED